MNAHALLSDLVGQELRTLSGRPNHVLKISGSEVILKLAEPASFLRVGNTSHRIKANPVTAPVVDTTAAGDSFAAAYLAARLGGAEPEEAARAGHNLAGLVVCHPGAIIPRSAMPPVLVSPRKASS